MLSELRTLLRSLLRSPGFSLSVILILGLGLGSATTIGTIAWDLLYPQNVSHDSENWVRIEIQTKEYPDVLPNSFLSRAKVYRESASSFSDLIFCANENWNLMVNGEPESVRVGRVAIDSFSALKVIPFLGRGFLPGEDKEGTEKVVILSHEIWRKSFGSNPDILGQSITIQSASHRVIGVMPRKVRLPLGYSNQDLWVPMPIPSSLLPQQMTESVFALGHLKPGVSASQAQAELLAMNPEKGTALEKRLESYKTVCTPSSERIRWMYSSFDRLSWAAGGSVFFLFAVACVNASSLMLVRVQSRRRELGIRLALGGTRWEVLRPLLLECMILVLVGLALGLVLSKWVVPALLALAQGQSLSSSSMELNWRSGVCLVVLGLISGLAVALFPAFRASRFSAAEMMKEGGGTVGESRRLRVLRGLHIPVQVALAVVLLAGSGLMIRSFLRLKSVDLGYDPSQKFQVNLSIPRTEVLSRNALYPLCRQIVERVAQLPGVKGVALGNEMLPRIRTPRKLRIVGKENLGEVEAVFQGASPDYFLNMGIPFRTGRNFEKEGGKPLPVAIISETMARRYFPEESPLGRVLQVSEKERLEIIGVVGDIRGQKGDAQPVYYVPLAKQFYFPALLIRTEGAPSAKFEAEIRRAVYEVQPSFVVNRVQSLEQVLNGEIIIERFLMAVLGLLSVFAVMLTAFGVFSTIAYSVDQRRGEFGIRLALGAPVSSIYWNVIGRGMLLVTWGVLAGLGLSWALSRFLDTMLYGIGKHDPLTYGTVGAVMLVVAVVASWLPARRAVLVDPSMTLRRD